MGTITNIVHAIFLQCAMLIISEVCISSAELLEWNRPILFILCALCHVTPGLTVLFCKFCSARCEWVCL